MLTDIFSLPQLTPGRARYPLTRMPAEAVAGPGVADRIADVQAAATALIEIRKAYDRSKGKSRARGKAVELDNQIDRIIGVIGTLAEGQQAALPESDPTHQASKELMALVLPLGVAAVTTLPFEEELSAVREMLADLDAAGDLAERAHVTHLIEALRELAPRFEAELAKKAAIVEFKQVEARQVELQHAVALLIAQIVANHPRPEDAEALAAALAPFRFQFAQIRELRRKRRRVVDVDPQSGSEVEG